MGRQRRKVKVPGRYLDVTATYCFPAFVAIDPRLFHRFADQVKPRGIDAKPTDLI